MFCLDKSYAIQNKILLCLKLSKTKICCGNVFNIYTMQTDVKKLHGRERWSKISKQIEIFENIQKDAQTISFV